MSEKYTYARVIIRGTITTQSPLHIGTGEDYQEKTEDSSVTVNSLALDIHNKPYIPASTLRGLLRSLCLNTELKEIIYGTARQHKEAETTGRSGAMRIYDARLQPEQDVSLQIISRTTIDPVTLTAKHHHLSTHEQVPTGTVFDLEIHLDKVNAEAINSIIASLESLATSRIGQGKSTGQGQIKWQLDESQSTLLYRADLSRWISSSSKTGTLRPASFTRKKYRTKNQSAIKKMTEGLHQSWHSQTMTIITDSPLLINDPHAVNKRADEEHAPDVIMLKQQSNAIIPASTLKGWARAQCRRILLTMVDGKAEEKIDHLIKQLFGSTESMSQLQFSDIVIPKTNYHQHKQTFIAIDRFTGGVKDGAMCNVEAIEVTQPLTTTIRYRDNLAGWMKILLLYCARDAIEGDLVLGWGKSKGFGRLQLQADFNALLAQYDEQQRQVWQAELEEKLA